jgi:hypothetical protein
MNAAFSMTRRAFVGTCAAAAAGPAAASVAAALPIRRPARARVAILGAGVRGDAVARALAARADVEVAVVADPDLNAATRLSATLPRANVLPPRVAFDDGAVFGDPSLDVWLVAAPAARATQLALVAAQTGAAALVLSPPSAGPDLDRLALAVRASGAAVRFASRCAHAELATWCDTDAPIRLEDGPRRAIIRTGCVRDAEGRLQFPRAAYADLVPAIRFLGGISPSSVRVGRGFARSRGAVVEVAHVHFRWTNGALLVLEGQSSGDGPNADAGMVALTLDCSSTRSATFTRGGTEGDVAQEGAACAEAFVRRHYPGGITGYPGTVADDLVAAFVLENAFA